MWTKCPTQHDQPTTLLCLGIHIQRLDLYISVAVGALGCFLFSPLHGLGFGIAVAVVLTVLKWGKAPGWMFHLLWSLDLWYIPGALRVCERHYTVWGE